MDKWIFKMRKFVNRVGRLNIVISIVSLLLAIPATVVFGPFAFIAAASIRVYPFESLQVIFMSLLGICGLFGIGGLWLRVFIHPSAEQSPSASDMVTWLLSAGAISSLAVAISIAYMEGLASAMDMSLEIVFIVLGVVGLVLAVHNLLSNRALRRNALERAGQSQ